MGFKKSTAKILSDNTSFVNSGRILDVGCGERIYEHIFPEAEYIGIDIEVSGRDLNQKLPNIYFDGINIPFEDGYFDFVVCTEVFEHCENPKRLINEMYRVLKSDGRALITTPFLWGEHEVPYDFRRYTSFGLKKNILQANFKILDSLLYINNNNLVLDGKLIVDIINDKEIYKFLQTSKSLRPKLEKLELNFNYNFDQQVIDFNDIKINDKLNENVNNAIKEIILKRNKLQNKIYFKNIMKQAIEAYVG